MNQVDKKYVILGSLCALVLMLVVGYAAFSTLLNVKGTSNISSNWDIKITKITSNVLNGTPTNATEPTGVGTLTATFETNLVSPGDSMQYVITITNNGSMNATLEKINISKPNNDMITFETSGLTEGSTLTSKGTADLTVTVTYKDIAEGQKQPDNTKGTLSVTLDYVQEGTSTVTPTPQLTTVYAYHTDTKTIGTSKLTSSDYVIDYTQISGYNETTKPLFLKYDIDSEGVIQNAYACMKFSFIDEPVCMQGGSADYYASNKAILEGLQEAFTANSGSCSIGDYHSYCSIGHFYVDSYYDGDAYVRDDGSNISCGVYSDGTANCP